jgi:hypothetical protein
MKRKKINNIFGGNINLFGNMKSMFAMPKMKASRLKTNSLGIFNIKEKRITPKPNRKLTYPQAIKRYPFIDPLGNYDNDKVMNAFDCRPFDKKKHGGKSTKAWRAERKLPIVQAQHHFKNQKVRAGYRSKFILPSGKIITTGAYSHYKVGEATNLSKYEFMRKTGAVALGEASHRIPGSQSRQIHDANFGVTADVPLTEKQKEVVAKIVKKTLSEKHQYGYTPSVAYDITYGRYGGEQYNKHRNASGLIIKNADTIRNPDATPPQSDTPKRFIETIEEKQSGASAARKFFARHEPQEKLSESDQAFESRLKAREQAREQEKSE